MLLDKNPEGLSTTLAVFKRDLQFAQRPDVQVEAGCQLVSRPLHRSYEKQHY